MKVEQHISQLLYRYPCVTVPGFGAFLAQTQSAQLNEYSHSFYPPRTIISFNSYLQHNDGLLANHVAKMERITFEDAVFLIEGEVALWRQILEINGHLQLKNIGELSLNAEKQIVFKPQEQQNYLKDAFGLTSFVSPVIRREQDVMLHLVENDSNNEQNIPTIGRARPDKFRVLKYAAAAVFTLSVGGYLGVKYFERDLQNQMLLVESEVQRKVQQKIQEATFVINTPIPSITMTLAETQMPYHVVAGAFRQEENADYVLKNLLRQGYSARKTEPNLYGLFQVLYGSYPTWYEAQQAMLKIKQNENPDAWLLIKQL
jgi:hypothetical protein